MTANQGTDTFTIIQAIRNLLQVTTQLDDRHVRLWYGPSRPQSGADEFVWLRYLRSDLDESPGPVIYGNKFIVLCEIHLAVRSFADEAQVDERRATIYHGLEFRIINTFQNRNLFPSYDLPTSTMSWVQPVPTSKLAPLSVSTMLLKSVPVPDKTQKEEGTVESQWELSVPSVLALNLPDS